MINKSLFFGQFQLNYFDYKLGSLEFLLENYSKVGLDERIIDYSNKDYINAIRSDIRQTYFQAIETVFEIFFALLPDKNGVIHENIMQKITLSDLPYSKIREIAEQEDYLDFLDTEIKYTDGTTLTLGEFIFYFGLHNQDRFKEKISNSLPAIKYALRVLAKEFSDRREYNSYKHGLRIIPALTEFAILDAETMETQATWELNDSMTFYSYDKKTQETLYTTKVFDSERDIRMTSICSNLLWSMIKSRSVAFKKEENNEKAQIAILFFGIDEIDKAMETNAKIQNLSYSIKPTK